ncbi:MAG: DinB family protein [Caldilineales bacterium]|nr:DinB family protein [Caldilineales bacterium]MCW5858806.1 DinB family protein [Caldilineales bacterium]
MSNQTQFKALFDYQYRTTRQILACAARLSQADCHEQPGYGRGSIHDLLFHLLRAGQSWRQALVTGRQQSSSRPEEYPDLPSLQAGFEAESAAWQAFLDGLSPDEIEAEVELTNWRGDVAVLRRWAVLQHLILHGMQHHAELAQLLTAKGQSPGDIDFIFYAMRMP